MFTKEILSNPDVSVPHCHCPSIACNPNGDIFVVWYAYPEEETRDGILIFSHKPAGSSKFIRIRRILTEMNSSLGNPLLYFGENGRLHLMFVALRGHYWDSATVYCTHSDNLGESWALPNTARMQPGMMVRYPPIVRRNGYLLLPAYDESTNQTVLFSTSPEEPVWQELTRFNDTEAIQGCIVRRNDDELNMLLRPGNDHRLCMRSISGDDGRTWSRIIPTTLPNPLSGVASIQMGDTLCAIYNHTYEHRRYPLSLSYSKDAGTSWSGPIHIDETEHEVSYPSFVVDHSGVAHGVYTFGRTRIQYVSFDQNWWNQ